MAYSYASLDAVAKRSYFRSLAKALGTDIPEMSTEEQFYGNQIYGVPVSNTNVFGATSGYDFGWTAPQIQTSYNVWSGEGTYEPVSFNDFKTGYTDDYTRFQNSYKAYQDAYNYENNPYKILSGYFDAYDGSANGALWSNYYNLSDDAWDFALNYAREYSPAGPHAQHIPIQDIGLDAGIKNRANAFQMAYERRANSGSLMEDTLMPAVFNIGASAIYGAMVEDPFIGALIHQGIMAGTHATMGDSVDWKNELIKAGASYVGSAVGDISADWISPSVSDAIYGANVELGQYKTIWDVTNQTTSALAKAGINSGIGKTPWGQSAISGVLDVAGAVAENTLEPSYDAEGNEVWSLKDTVGYGLKAGKFANALLWNDPSGNLGKATNLLYSYTDPISQLTSGYTDVGVGTNADSLLWNSYSAQSQALTGGTGAYSTPERMPGGGTKDTAFVEGEVTGPSARTAALQPVIEGYKSGAENVYSSAQESGDWVPRVG